MLAFAVALVAASVAGCFADPPRAPNRAPVASLAVSPTSTPTKYILDASASQDADGDALTYHWNWVVGHAMTEVPRLTAELSPEAVAGNAAYLVALIVRDPAGAAGAAFGSIVVGSGANEPPEVQIAPTNRWVRPGTEVVLDAGNTTDPDGDKVVHEWTWGPRAGFDPHASGPQDQCAETDARPGVFTTGCLAMGAAFDVPFDRAGTFDIHCHPHPGMKGRIIVDPTLAAAAAPVVVPIENFGFTPEPVVVGVGSTIRFVNRDPVPHTATIEDWIPGIASGGSAKEFRETLAEGEYVVRLVASDAKGGRAAHTWGIKVTSDAPVATDWTTSGTPRPPGQEVAAPAYVREDFLVKTGLDLRLEWTDPTAGQAVQGNVSVWQKDGDEWSRIDYCKGRPVPGAAAVQVSCEVPAGAYGYLITAAQGVVDWTLAIRTTPFGTAGFGDGGGEQPCPPDCHH